MELRQALIAKTLRVPAVEGPAGDGAAVARQFDVALLSVGFKGSRELLEHLSGLHPAVAQEVGETALGAVRRLVGDHVRHNAYFIDFPANVPDTQAFWSECVADALADPRTAGNIATQLARRVVNLLDLPKYGRYQHSYEELLAAHEPLIAAASDRVTVLGLGAPLAEDSHALYLVAGDEPDPALGGGSRACWACSRSSTSATRSRRRSRSARAGRWSTACGCEHGLALELDTPVDVLRLACALSDGDVSLREPTRFRSLRRAERRALLAALDAVAEPASSPTSSASPSRSSAWGSGCTRTSTRASRPRRTCSRWPAGSARRARSPAASSSRWPRATWTAAIAVLANAPGMLVRSVDRLARAGAGEALADAVRAAAPAVSTRVLLSLREHLLNRSGAASVRVFVNQESRSWVTGDERAPLPGGHGRRARAGPGHRAGRPAAARAAARGRPGGADARGPADGQGPAGRARDPAARVGPAAVASRALLRLLEAARAGAPTTTSRCCCSTTTSCSPGRCRGRTSRSSARCTRATSSRRRTARRSSSTSTSGGSRRATSCRRSTSTAARASTTSRRRSSASWSASRSSVGGRSSRARCA